MYRNAGPARRRGAASRVRARGVSLIEVMVAILVFSAGMLGLALMQMKGAQFTKDAGSRTNAIIQAGSLADAMRANPKGVDPANGSSSYYLYDGSTAPDASQCGGVKACEQAKTDLANWLAHLKAGVSGPVGTTPLATVTRDAKLGTFTVTVSFSGLDTNGDGKITSADDGAYSISFLP